MNTVALIFEGQEPLIIPNDVARREHDRLQNLTLVHPEDARLFAALTVALGVPPTPELPAMPDGTSHASFIIAQWREQFRELTS